MKVESLGLREFSVFKEVELDFSPGINVFLGTNATGKSHTMKALYAVLKTFEQNGTTVPLEARLQEKFANVFKPDDRYMGRLVRRRTGQSKGRIAIKGTTGEVALTLNTRTKERPIELGTATWKSEAPSIFLPTREVLAMYEGFAAAYQDRELSFDETYYDACVALSRAVLKGPRSEQAKALIVPIEAALEEGGDGPVLVDRGGTLAELPDNPILDEFTRHYDFARKLFDEAPPEEPRS